MVLTSLLTTVLLASAVVGEPTLMTLPLIKTINVDNPVSGTLPTYGQLRAQALKLWGELGQLALQRNSLAKNEAVAYVASVGVGSPPTQYDLIVDSGSANFWVGANKSNPYVKTSTSIPTTQSVAVSYGSGNFTGLEYIDTVTITKDLVIKRQSIGVASTSFGFSTVDGIIGIGPVDLTNNTLSPNKTELIPTVPQNLFSQGTILRNVVAVSFKPTNTNDTVNGEITWGGIDYTQFIGLITFVKVTTTFPSSMFWGINASMSYGSGAETIMANTAGIVDTGTTLVLIPSDAFSKYQSATGGVLDQNTGLLLLNSAQFKNLQTLNVVVEGNTFGLTANAQIWPRSLNTFIGGVASGIYLIVSSTDSQSGSGLDFLLGQTFLERFYAIFDTDKNSVGLARTWFTDATTN